jgi:hypothetical protein
MRSYCPGPVNNLNLPQVYYKSSGNQEKNRRLEKTECRLGTDQEQGLWGDVEAEVQVLNAMGQTSH